MRRVYTFVLIAALSIPAMAMDITDYLSIDGGYTGEVAGNVMGGYKTGCTYDGLIDLGFEFRSDSVCNHKWPGAKFRISAQSTHGAVPTEMVGDVQGVSNIAIGNYAIFLRHLYYSQEVGPVRFIVGLQDINDEYDHLDGAGDFINSSWGISPLFANVFSLPTYPNTALAFDFKWNITPMWAWQFAAYDTPYSLDEYENPYNVNWKFTLDKGFQLVTEFHCTPVFNGNLPGAYKLGASYHLENDTVPGQLVHRWGINANIEQAVYNTDLHTVTILAKGGYIPKLGQSVSFAHAALGVTLQGVFSKHKRDMMGLGVTSTMFTRDRYEHETAIELTYKYTFLDCLYLQPDIQYVISPGLIPELTSETNPANALVLMLRFGASF